MKFEFACTVCERVRKVTPSARGMYLCDDCMADLYAGKLAGFIGNSIDLDPGFLEARQ